MELVANQNTQITEAVQSLLGQLLHEVDSSKTLHKAGLDTRLTKFISTLIEDPVKAQIQAHDNTFSSLASTVDVIMKLFFKEKSTQIDRAFKEVNGGAVLYYILLKIDTQEVRDEFFECLNVFDDFGFDDKIKVLIRFIPQSFSDKISFKHEIIFK